MPGINGDDDVAAVGFVAGHVFDDRRLGQLSGLTSLKINHQTMMADAVVRGQRKAFIRHGGGGFDHQPQIGFIATTTAQADHIGVRNVHLVEIRVQISTGEINNNAVRRGQLKDLVFMGFTQVQYKTNVIRRLPDPDAIDIRIQRGTDRARKRGQTTPYQQPGKPLHSVSVLSAVKRCFQVIQLL